MQAKVGYVVIDAADPAALARFWCGLLAVTIDTEIGDGGIPHPVADTGGPHGRVPLERNNILIV